MVRMLLGLVTFQVNNVEKVVDKFSHVMSERNCTKVAAKYEIRAPTPVHVVIEENEVSQSVLKF